MGQGERGCDQYVNSKGRVQEEGEVERGHRASDHWIYESLQIQGAIGERRGTSKGFGWSEPITRIQLRT